MSYNFAMNSKLLPALSGIVFLFAAALRSNADLVEMRNGDRFSGRVLSVSADTVVLQNETLGKISVPRAKVSSLEFGTNTIVPAATGNIPRVPAPTNLPPAAALTVPAGTNVDLSAALRRPGMDTNFIQQVRDQLLGGSPAAAGKYDEMVGGLMNGSLSLDDLRREARAAADQIRELKHELGPEAGDALDAYLTQLNSFLEETDDKPANTNRVPR